MLKEDIQKIRKQENLHILLWLIKDTCWVTGFKIGGMVLILPTLIVAIAITWRWRHLRAELFHNTAVCFWLGANITWMIGEFYFDDTTRPIAIVFFAFGLFAIAYYHISNLITKSQRHSS
jgi:hypothetical protein